MKNRILDIRPTSTFDNFVPQNDNQQKVKQWLENLADQVADKLQQWENWFDHAKVVNMWWWPWRWKSHLLEAFANRLITLWRWDDIYLFRDTLHSTYGKPLSELRERVVLLDDLFSESKSTDDINKYWPLQWYSDYAFWAYERRKFTLTSSNFPTEWVIDRIEKEIDPIWRITSRMREIWQATIEIIWDDYRGILSKQREEDPFSL